MKALYIFATSDRPDPYVNTIAYAADHLHPSSVTIVVVSEAQLGDENVQRSSLLATAVTLRILEQLEALVQGKYVSFQKDEKRVETLESSAGIEAYQRGLRSINQNLSTRLVGLRDLDGFLRNLVQEGNCIFDVTALKKNLLVDVVATLISLQFSEVYSFEILKKPTFGPSDLYHMLQPGDGYLFRNLASSNSVKVSLARIGRWSLNVRRALFMVAMLTAAIFIAMSLYPESKVSFALTVAGTVASIAQALLAILPSRGE
jgi:hypothetical protein